MKTRTDMADITDIRDSSDMMTWPSFIYPKNDQTLSSLISKVQKKHPIQNMKIPRSRKEARSDGLSVSGRHVRHVRHFRRTAV